MKLQIKKGTTSKRIAVFIQDSSSTTGAGLTGLTSASAGLTWYYWREDQGNVGASAVTLAAATRGTFTSGGFVEKDATNMPGWYELGVPDAVIASGANWAEMHLKGATNMAPLPIEIQLVDYDPNDAVRMGLTAIPNANAGANGGLPTVDASNGVTVRARDSLLVRNGTAQAGAAGTITLDASASATTDFYVGQTIKIDSGTGAGQSRVITAYNGTTKVATVDRNWATNPDATSVFSVMATDAPKTDSSLQTTAASVQGNVTGSVASVTGAVGSVTGSVGGNVVGSVGSVASSVTVGTNNDKTGYTLSAAGVQAIWDALTSALTTVGSIGKLLVTNIDAAISSRLASASYTAPDNTTITTLNNKLGTFTGSGINTVLGFLRALMRKDAALTPSDVGGTFDNTTDSQEAMRDNMGTPQTGDSYARIGANGSGLTQVGIAAGGIGSGAHAAAELNNIADAMLDRNMATGTDSGTNSTAVRTARQALRALRNKVNISGGVATVTKEDDVTTSWTASVSTAAGNPISGVDPS